MPDVPTSRRRRPHRRSLLAALGAAGAAAVGLSFGLEGCAPSVRRGQNGEEAKLNFYNWDTYVGKDTLAEFKEATGVDVNMSLFANNDELFAKLRAGNPGFDVIVPTNEFVTRLRLADLIPGYRISRTWLRNSSRRSLTRGVAIRFRIRGWSSASAIENPGWTARLTPGNGCLTATVTRGGSRSSRRRMI